MNAKQGARGVRCFEVANRPSPFLVQWTETVFDQATGERRKHKRTESFKTADARDRRAADLAEQKRAGALVTAGREEIEDFRAFKRATDGTPWTEVVTGWQAWRKLSGIETTAPSVADHFARQLAHAETLHKRGELSADTLRQKRQKLTAFKEAFGETRLDKVTPREVEQWIDGLGHASPHTFNNVRKILRTAFSDAVDHRVIRDNPLDLVPTRDDSIHQVGILTVEQARKLFRTVAEHPRFKRIAPRLALEAFIGLRFASACRIAAEDIRTADRGIMLPAAKIKTRRRHYIDGLPENAWEWLALNPPGMWEIDARQYLELKSGAFEAAKVPHPHNALRHSFASYHVAAFKNPGLTAYILCHRGQEKLWENYKGNASEADGREYFKITPQSVLA